MLCVRLNTLHWLPLSILLVASLQACSGAVERGEVWKIGIGTPREEVEALLGEPIETEETDEEVVYVYQYFQDANEAAGLPHGGYGGCYGCFIYLFIIPFALVADYTGVGDPAGLLHIVYDADETVKNMRIETPSERRGAEESAEELETHRRRAKAGNINSQYQLSLIEPMELERGYWTCVAANNGHPMAQVEMGRRYWYGINGLEENRPYAFMWFNLAKESGHERGEIEVNDYEPRLSPAEAAEAKQLLADWHSNPESCRAFWPEAAPPDISSGS